MRFVLDGKTYDLDHLSKLSLMDIMRFDRESELGNWGITWDDVTDMIEESAALTKEERKRHRGSRWLLALSVWRAFREAGEPMSFEAAIDKVPALDSTRITWLPDPEDHKPANPRKARPSRKGSGGA